MVENTGEALLSKERKIPDLRCSVSKVPRKRVADSTSKGGRRGDDLACHLPRGRCSKRGRKGVSSGFLPEKRRKPFDAIKDSQAPKKKASSPPTASRVEGEGKKKERDLHDSSALPVGEKKIDAALEPEEKRRGRIYEFISKNGEGKWDAPKGPADVSGPGPKEKGPGKRGNFFPQKEEKKAGFPHLNCPRRMLRRGEGGNPPYFYFKGGGESKTLARLMRGERKKSAPIFPSPG